MNYKINYLNNIKIPIPYDTIFFRLGYKKNKTVLPDIDKKKIINLINESVNLCSNKIVYKFCSKTDKGLNKIILDSEFIIESKSLFELLFNCDNVVLMAATSGFRIIKKRDYEIKKGNPVFSLILDATASEITDSLLDWLEKYLKIKLRRENKFLTKRFSPGYGDLNLIEQRKIYKHLKLKKIGISINKNNILIPEKTVIAIAGIKEK